MTEPICSIDGCEAPVFVKSRGWCRKHYTRWHRYGDPEHVKQVRAPGDPVERWLAKVNKDGPIPDARPDLGRCWDWTASLDKGRYGQFDVTEDGKHRNHRAHRWGYETFVRPLVAGEEIDHLCRRTMCVNPEHMDPVSHKLNVVRGDAGVYNAQKTHCSHGHEFTEENTYYHPTGGRQCKTCNRVNTRNSMRKKRGSKPRVDRLAERSCVHGHLLTVDNVYVSPRGYIECHECRRTRVRESQRKRRAAEREARNLAAGGETT